MVSFGFATTGSEVVEAFKDRVAGRVFLITGPSPDGIGAETAFNLAKAGPKLLILAGRSQSKIQPVIDQLQMEGISILFLLLDLGSQKSIRNAVEILKERGTKVDVLINNAAVMACPWSVTAEGIESQFGTNHVGPFLFTNLLIKTNLIEERIVNVNSSASVRKASFVLPPLDDLSYSNGVDYDPVQAYSVSKTANLLYSRSLASKLRNRDISVFSLNPGSIKSPLQRHLTKEISDAMFAAAYRENPGFVPPDRKTVAQGSATQLRAALDPSLVSFSGAYLDDCEIYESTLHVEAYGAAQKVWEISEKLVGEKFGF